MAHLTFDTKTNVFDVSYLELSVFSFDGSSINLKNTKTERRNNNKNN